MDRRVAGRREGANEAREVWGLLSPMALGGLLWRFQGLSATSEVGRREPHHRRGRPLAATRGRDAPGVQLGRDGAERGLISATIGARQVAWLQLGRRQRVPAAGLLHPPGDGEADECVQHVLLVVPPCQRLLIPRGYP